jgi:hemerythrin superfamily protein
MLSALLPMEKPRETRRHTMRQQLFEALRKDHQEVREIFRNMLENEQPAQREKLMNQLQQEVLPHMKAEEKVVYPALRKNCEDCQEQVLESIEEHHAAELILKELLKLKTSDERFHAKTMVLQEMIEHHVKEEEKEIFKGIRKNIDDKQAGDILEKFAQEKERVKSQLH